MMYILNTLCLFKYINASLILSLDIMSIYMWFYRANHVLHVVYIYILKYTNGKHDFRFRYHVDLHVILQS